MYISQDAVTEAAASRLNVDKGTLLERDSSALAVRVAALETQLISETKAWLEEEAGMDVQALEKSDRGSCPRRRETLLVKNVPPRVSRETLEEVLARHGRLVQLLVAPGNALAVARYESEAMAAATLQKLAYYHILPNAPIYIEYAPDLFKEHKKSKGKRKREEMQEKDAPLEEVEDEGEEKETKKSVRRSVFVKNLNFATTEQKLRFVFKEAAVGEVLSARIVRGADRGSAGYGFVEFDSALAARKAVRKIQDVIVDEHALKLALSKAAAPGSEGSGANAGRGAEDV